MAIDDGGLEPPYHVAVITVERSDVDDGYAEMAEAMDELVRRQPGFLGVDSVYDAERRVGITSSYWVDAAAIAGWRRQVDHLVAQRLGRERWYRSYTVRVARVERDYRWSAPPA